MVITGYYAKPTNYTSIGVSVGGVGARSPIEFELATSDHLPQSSNRDERATDKCFALTGAHQCGVLVVDSWMTGFFCIHHKSNTCCFNRNKPVRLKPS